MTKVTVAIPTRNREKYLKAAIGSVLAQTFQDFEIIVFDNNSNYNVKALLNQFGDFRVSLISSTVDLGGQGNFNRVFTHLFQTPYVIVFHDDDAMHPQFLERSVKVMDANPGAVWSGTALTFIRSDYQMFKFKKLAAEPAPLILPASGLVRLLLKHFPLAFDSLLYRSKFLEDVSQFGDEFEKWGDRPYLVQLAEKGVVAILPEPLVNYRIHQTQDSQGGITVQTHNTYNRKLFENYSRHLPQPISAADRKLLLTFTTNSLLLSAAGVAHGFMEYRTILKSFEPDYFSWKYIRIRGLWYFLKTLRKFYL